MARPPLLRARARSEGAATKTPSAAVPGTARDLLFSFTKKGKGKKKRKKEGSKKRWGKIVPKTPAVTGAAHLGAPLVERGRWAGKGRRNKGIGRLGGPAPCPASRRRSLLLLFPPPPPTPGGKRRRGSRLATRAGAASLYLARIKTALDSHGVPPFPPGG